MKLLGGYAVLVLFTIALLAAFISGQIEEDTLAKEREALADTAALVSELARPRLRGETDRPLQAVVARLGGDTETRITIIGGDGAVIADSDENPDQMENHGSRPEVVAARNRGFGTFTRRSDTLGLSMMYVALPIRENNEILGFARASLPLGELERRLSNLRQAVLLGAALAMTAALILGFFVARRVTKPLQAISNAAGEIAGGRYGQPLLIRSTDEVGRLAENFNLMQEQLRERMETISDDRNKLLAILGSMVEGVVAVDREERIVHINEVAAHILHTNIDTCSGKKIWEATRVTEVVDALERTLREGADVRREATLLLRHGDREIEIISSALQDGTGEPAGAVVVLHDVTELHKVAKIKHDFVTNASHELKTPIAAVRGLVETLLDDQKMDTEQQRGFLNRIKDQSLRLQALVEDMLALSRLESISHAPRFDSLDLRQAATDAALTVSPSAKSKGLTIETSMPAEPMMVIGEYDALQKMVENLLDNAVKYTHSGGSVWIRLYAEGRKAVLEIEDTGIGIEPSARERIFERFFRVDKGRSRKLGGTGLGLSIVKNIALAHKGEVGVQSTPGDGSTFWVTLPLQAGRQTGAD